jgi:serine/threonine protein kinase
VEPDGQLLGGRYALDELIAGGGMGQVFRARDSVLNRDVAVKVLRSEYTGHATFLARFRAEAQHAAGLVHPNIATLFDYGEVDSPTGEHLAYLVMELVRGESLSTLLARERRLSTERTLEILRQSAAGLAAAHAIGVFHRDVKPGNVLLGTDGSVKLTDFGVAVSATSVPLTRTGEVVGTANYLSPEQAEGRKATAASDVYALGLIGYECLAGHRGFEGGTPTQIALRQIREVPPPLPADVPEPVRRLIDRAIAKDPAQRIPDGASLTAALDEVLAGRPADAPSAEPRTMVMPAVRSTEPVPSPTPPPPFPATRAFLLPPDDEVHDLAELRPLEDDEAEPARRRRWPWALAALLTLLVVGAGSVVFLQLAADRPASSAGGTATSSPTPSTVQLVSLALPDYVGRPVAQVQAELAARGLPVTLEPRETADVPADQVITVNPVGQVAPGTPITVVYAVAPPPPPPTPTPAPTPEATPTPDATPEATLTPTEQAVPTGTVGNRDGNGGEGGNRGGDDGRGRGGNGGGGRGGNG